MNQANIQGEIIISDVPIIGLLIIQYQSLFLVPGID